jgi:glycosyltransferase involved in cell wall biosynthesis
VFPSFYEPFGIVLLEAMHCGKAIIASNVGGIPSILEDGHTGLLFDPGNVNDLAEKIIMLLKDKDLRINMGNAGYKKVTEFTWDKVTERTVDIYRKTTQDTIL